MDMEKVIKGLECCHVMVHDMGPDKSSCGICPYKDVQTETQIDLGGIECIAVLHDDILALLKEQPEVVRCADCKYLEHLPWLDDANGFKCYVCRKHSFTGMRTPDWFCADGERR